MRFSLERIVVVAVSIELGAVIGVLGSLVRPQQQYEPSANQVIGTIAGHEIDIRASTTSPALPVRMDVYKYCADIHFGKDMVRINNSGVTLPGGLITYAPRDFKTVDVIQTKQGFRVWVNGKEVVPRISEEARKAKQKDLQTFDELRDDLENADHFELLSIDPATDKMLGKTVIEDRAIRKKLLDAMRKGIVDFEHEHIVLCFDPRHEIFTRRNGDSQRMTICFECAQVEAWGGRKFQIAETPQPVFDKVLRDAGVPLPKPSLK